jgi:glycosyltransferase involved in cell wall biosynthesis
VRYYRNEENLGAGPNFNRTFELARGRYFRWAAHDDLLEPTYLERCVEALDRDVGAVLCQAGVRQIDEDGRTIAPVHFPLVGAADPSPSRRFARNVLATHSCRDIFGLIRSEALRGMPLHEGRLDTDRIILAELSLRGRFVHIPEPLFIHRDHPQRFVHAAHGDRHARIMWYNPRRAGDRSRHRAVLWRSYFASVRRSAPTSSTRLSCYGCLLCWPVVQSAKFIRLKMYQKYNSLDPRSRTKIRRVKRLLFWWRVVSPPPAEQARPHG